MWIGVFRYSYTILCTDMCVDMCVDTCFDMFVMGLSFMTWHKEHMTGSEVLKMQTNCEPFGSHIGTDGNPHASQVATG